MPNPHPEDPTRARQARRDLVFDSPVRIQLHMKKLTWAFSGLLLLVGLPILVVLEAMLFGGAQVHPGDLTPVNTSMIAIPLVWLGALIACLVEAKRRRRERLMWFYRLSPFAAIGVHLLVTALTMDSIHSRPRRARDEAIAKYTAAIHRPPPWRRTMLVAARC